MYFDAALYNALKPWATISEFVNKTLPDLDFTSKKPEVVMDVGCGPGQLSKNVILPCFPNLSKMIAMDLTPGMIEEAKTKHSHPKIEYVVADIEDRSTVLKWMNEITKLTVVHSFNWLKNQQRGFETCYDLLKPGGAAAFLFPLNSPYYDGLIETGKCKKYSSYFEKADYFIPESYIQKLDSSHYGKMLKKIGFKVVHCMDEIKEDIFSSDQEFRDVFYSVCPLVKYLPANLKNDFKEDLFQSILKQNKRTEDGRPIHRCKTIEIVVKKEA